MPKNEIAMHQKHERLKGFNEAISESNCEGMIINMDDLKIYTSIKSAMALLLWF